MTEQQYNDYVSICVSDAFALARLDFTPSKNRHFPEVTLENIIGKLALTLGALNIVFILALAFCIVRYFYL